MLSVVRSLARTYVRTNRHLRLTKASLMTKSMPSYSRNTLFPVLVRSNKNINSGIIPVVSHSALVNLDFLISPTHIHILVYIQIHLKSVVKVAC